MTTTTDDRECKCGAVFLSDGDDDLLCGACLIEEWEDYCEECGADPEEPCAEGCVNEHKSHQ